MTTNPTTRAMTFPDVAEGIRNALAAYCQALDDGRVDDIVATFTVDGTVDIPGMGTHRGTDALRDAYTKWTPRKPQRHLVVNTHIVEWNQTNARSISDVVFLLQGKEGWAVQVVGRYDDQLHFVDHAWRFHHRGAEFVQ